MKKYIYPLFSTVLLVLCFIVLNSCRKDLEVTTQSESSEKKAANDYSNYRVAADGSIVLGKKLENPYTVETMRKAYANVVAKTKGKVSEDKSTVRTTHYYLRFLPKDWKEYNLLKADTSLALYDIPLDYEIALHGNKYQDPMVCDTCPTWQYTAVEKDYKFNEKIRHEILSELYIPETDQKLAQMNIKEKVSEKSFLNALIDEAMVLTKNYSDTLNPKKAKNGRVNWTPSGTIRVFDTRLNQLIGLAGVEIRVRRWFTTHHTMTDPNGSYVFPWVDYDRPANYSLYFHVPPFFDVRSGTYGQAWINGPKIDFPWNHDMTGGVERYYAHVFRGAFRYHFGNIGGLRRPFVGTPIKYAAYDATGESQGVNTGNWPTWGLLPNIKIYRYGNNGEWGSDDIFATTCHETAHSSHWSVMNLGPIQFFQVSNFIVESWATAVELSISQMEYRERGIFNYGGPFYDESFAPIRRSNQVWRIGFGRPNYSSLDLLR